MVKTSPHTSSQPNHPLPWEHILPDRVGVCYNTQISSLPLEPDRYSRKTTDFRSGQSVTFPATTQRLISHSPSQRNSAPGSGDSWVLQFQSNEEHKQTEKETLKCLGRNCFRPWPWHREKTWHLLKNYQKQHNPTDSNTARIQSLTQF